MPSSIKNSRYCGRHLPSKPIPEGRYLVHNHIVPAMNLGERGFRAWVQEGRTDPKLVECRCDFGGCRNAELHTHYRVANLVPRGWTTANSDDIPRWRPKNLQLMGSNPSLPIGGRSSPNQGER